MILAYQAKQDEKMRKREDEENEVRIEWARMGEISSSFMSRIPTLF